MTQIGTAQNLDLVSVIVSVQFVLEFHRKQRGGSFHDDGTNLYAADRNFTDPTIELLNFGFRVAKVSGQTTVPAVSDWGMVASALLVLTAGTLVWSRRSPAIA